MRFAYLYFLAFIALFADFLANDKPLICKTNSGVHFPATKALLVKNGLAQWQTPLDSIDLYDAWKTYPFKWSCLAPIPYAPTERDAANKKLSPLDAQEIRSLRYRHWLGTDADGHDILAGLISGTRIAFLVVLTVLGIASLIGISFGLLAGYYGDKKLKVGVFSFILGLLGLFIGLFWAFVSRKATLASGGFLTVWLSSFLLISLPTLLASKLGKVLDSFLFKKKVALPLDLLLMRSADVFNAIPGLILITAAVTLPKTPPSLWMLMALIGFFSWPSLALFIRGEMLRIRSLPYMEAAQLLGLSDFQTLWRHALPNALPPAWIALSLSVGSAILLEASLSYLGLANNFDTMSWGRLILQGKNYPTAWWIMLFPGLMLFFTVRFFYRFAFFSQEVKGV